MPAVPGLARRAGAHGGATACQSRRRLTKSDAERHSPKSESPSPPPRTKFEQAEPREHARSRTRSSAQKRIGAIPTVAHKPPRRAKPGSVQRSYPAALPLARRLWNSVGRASGTVDGARWTLHARLYPIPGRHDQQDPAARCRKLAVPPNVPDPRSAHLGAEQHSPGDVLLRNHSNQVRHPAVL